MRTNYYITQLRLGGTMRAAGRLSGVSRYNQKRSGHHLGSEFEVHSNKEN